MCNILKIIVIFGFLILIPIAFLLIIYDIKKNKNIYPITDTLEFEEDPIDEKGD